MGRISIKGGVWTNTEDEILKAAVMKYGKNQWARIASLLHRKSAKQCKARWLEWLDPAIKKTEWSKEEDEKLLHMAKLMPTQWRTIAPIVGRTAHQCFERYEYLLDKAQNNLDANVVKTKNELESNPETKPARPDPVDMDEDELEMLSEARARLANTQGKKAKRKARERQLQDARRLAALQKTRELKAAGITLKDKHRRGKRVMDYNLEIPFEKRPQHGLHDTSNEVFVPEPYDFNSLRQHDLDTQRKITDKREAGDKDKQKRRKDLEMPPFELISSSQQLAKRKKLDLPAPQVSDQQLEEIVKFGNLAESSRERAVSELNSATDLTNLLISDGGTTPMMTPRTPMQGNDDSISRDALNILALSNVDTPLAGGLNTPLSQIKFDGKSAVQTPNTVLNTGVTSGVISTPNPDEINIDDNASVTTSMSQNYGRRELMRALHSLPRPQNECELSLAGNMDVEEVKIGSNARDGYVHDQEDIEAAILRREREEAQCRFRRRSQVIQRNLPRPVDINTDILRPNDNFPLTDLQNAEELIKREMLIMLHYDALEDPVVGRKCAKTEQFLYNNPYDDIDVDDMEQAKVLLESEMSEVRVGMEHGDISMEEYESVWNECLGQIIYFPGQERYTRLSILSAKDTTSSYEHKLNTLRDHMTKDGKRAGKIESKLQIIFGGYQSRAQHFVTNLERLAVQLDHTKIELETFARLHELEKATIPRRIECLINDVTVQMAREKDLQEKYRVLLSETHIQTNGVK